MQKVPVGDREVQRSTPGGGVSSFFSLLLFSVGQNKNVAYLREERQPGREGFKLLSVSVTPCYLDSNYTCQLSLSPHLSLSPRQSVLAHSTPCSTRLYAHSLSFSIHLYLPSVSVSITVCSLSSVSTAALILFVFYYLTKVLQQLKGKQRGEEHKADPGVPGHLLWMTRRAWVEPWWKEGQLNQTFRTV